MNWSAKRPWGSFTTVSNGFDNRTPWLNSPIVGQTPKKIFNAPHPARMMHGAGTLPLGTLFGIEEDYRLLEQGHKALRGKPTELLVN